MKAIEIIKRLTSGYIELEQTGTVHITEDIDIDKYFGTEDYEWKGRTTSDADYLYMYIMVEDEVSVYHRMGELPDVYCERTQLGDIVALWRIE